MTAWAGYHCRRRDLLRRIVGAAVMDAPVPSTSDHDRQIE